MSPFDDIAIVSSFDYMDGAMAAIRTTRELGLEIRRARSARGWSQAELAAMARVGRPWLSEVERGKPTAEVGRILAVLDALGLAMDLVPAPGPSGPVDLDEIW